MMTDVSGRRILDMTARLGLEVLNDGTTTFRRDDQEETVPDITLASENIADSVTDWRVTDRLECW